MKTQGEMEFAICAGITRFEQEYRGRGPKDIKAYLLGDFVVVRLQSLLTSAEQQLDKIPSEKGRDLLQQVRTSVLPGIDGFEVAKRLRQQPHLSGVVLFALAGYVQATDKQRSQEAGQHGKSGVEILPRARYCLLVFFTK
jgi:hypothetical protein